MTCAIPAACTAGVQGRQLPELAYNGHMPFGVGFKSPFESHVNAEDRRRLDGATSLADVANIQHEASHEQAQGRGSMGDLLSANKSLGDSLGASLGGTSAVTNVSPVPQAYNDSTPHAGRDPTTG